MAQVEEIVASILDSEQRDQLVGACDVAAAFGIDEAEAGPRRGRPRRGRRSRSERRDAGAPAVDGW